MKLNQDIVKILDKALDEQPIGREEALTLMGIDLLSREMYSLCAAANELSRRHFENLGEVYLQIGLDSAPCPSNCEFCSFGANHGIFKEVIEYPIENIIQAAKLGEDQGANGIYLMTTARYPFDKFIKVAKAVKEAVLPDLPLVANIADFNIDRAKELASIGFKAIYHAVRLNEGRGTKLPVKQRIQTIEAAKKEGIKIHFCVEPVGPEHTPGELVDLMFLGKELGATFSGAMRRVCVPGTPAAEKGTITWWNLARTVAVCRLVMGNTVLGHCTHEPNLPSLLAGANLLWAEVGTNPRDDKPNTEASRGWDVLRCQEILVEAGYEVRSGPAITALGSSVQDLEYNQ